MFFWPCIIVQTFQNTNLVHNSFNIQQYICYITLLNMFQAARCSSSGGPIVSPQPLVSSPSKQPYSMRVVSGLSPLSSCILYSCTTCSNFVIISWTEYSFLSQQSVISARKRAGFLPQTGYLNWFGTARPKKRGHWATP